MKATEQYFRLVLCIMRYKVLLTFAPIDKILCDNQRKPIKQYFPVVLFIMVYMVVLTL